MMQAVFGARDSLREKMRCLLDARSQEEQADIHRDIEPHLWGRLARWAARQPALMTLLKCRVRRSISSKSSIQAALHAMCVTNCATCSRGYRSLTITSGVFT